MVPPLPSVSNWELEQISHAIPSVTNAMNHAACKYCAWPVAKNNRKRKLEHLTKCETYQKWAEQQPKKDSSETARGAVNSSASSSLSIVERKDFERSAATAVFEGGLPFTTFDPKYRPKMVQMLQCINPAIQGVSRYRIAGLVSEIYADVEIDGKKELGKERYLNFITDGSESRNGDRIINFAVNTEHGHTFFIANISIADNTQMAKYLLEKFVEVAREVTEGRLERVNSRADDT